MSKAPLKKVKKLIEKVSSKPLGIAPKARPKSAKKAALVDSISQTIKLFKRYYPDAHCALDFTNPFELIVATSLSAQCTDERVNMVTPALFKKYPTPQEMAKADLGDLEQMVRTTGFFRNKAKNLKSCAQTLAEKYGGKVPANLEALVELGGVGRKTANVVLGNAFGIASGVVVDTHVTRLANRLGWVKGKNAVILERQLNELVPQDEWIMISHYLISHGRAICKARKPACSHCFLEEACPKKGV